MMTEVKFFEAIVEIETESENSKGEIRTKKHKELYLVDAMTITEAEARVIGDFEKSMGVNEFKVFSIKESKVVKVINRKEKKENTSL